MNRRKSIRALAGSVVAPKVLLARVGLGGGTTASRGNETAQESASFASDWHRWPDMRWVGAQYWGNRLQDWRIESGKLVCVVRGKNRTLHSLVCQLTASPEPFETSVVLELITNGAPSDQYGGFRIGAHAPDRHDDYRCAAVFGEGLDAGLTATGNLFIGDSVASHVIPIRGAVVLTLRGSTAEGGYGLRISASDSQTGKVLDELSIRGLGPERLRGNLALVAHDAREQRHDYAISVEGYSLTDEASERKTAAEDTSARFSQWRISGPKISYRAGQVFGPILFAQYTVNQKVLKLTAQLAPVEAIRGHKVQLQLHRGNAWKTIQQSAIDPAGRSAHFRVEDWNSTAAVPYRVKLEIPLRVGREEFFYEGTIAAEPLDRDELKVAVFSCNGDGGFPDMEITRHVAHHEPDMAVFLGDQFYESHGGFQIEPSPPDKAALDYLRKWYMFGWSYRDIFRHIPCAIMPDDHDVYHGNVWGEGGKHAPTGEGWAYVAQDQGG